MLFLVVLLLTEMQNFPEVIAKSYLWQADLNEKPETTEKHVLQLVLQTR